MTSALTKRLLVTISHAIEQFAVGSARADEPVVVIAMFQKLSYFEREVEMYRRIAARASVTVIGLVEDLPPALPAGISHVLLSADEELATEWSVTVLTPHSGATVVALDTESVDPDTVSLEGGRLFAGRWSFRREDAYQEAMRLRTTLAGRLPEAESRRLDDTLRRLVSGRGWLDEARPEAALTHLLGVLDGHDRARGRLRNQLDRQLDERHERDARSGLPTGRYLSRWLSGSGDGTLPLGLMLMRFHELDGIGQRYGQRAESAAIRTIGSSLAQLATPTDRVVHLAPSDFLLLAPSQDPHTLLARHAEVAAVLAENETRFPFVPLPNSAAVTVTRRRPLPLPTLVDTVHRPGRHGAPGAAPAAGHPGHGLTAFS